ncbi:MAG TPA: transporter substrate-binding domain-containing protein [Thermomicrobiales bacterium]|nr:transporter substrate-binding domain-containing protein [Thermomicrobiales bacterium]
MSSFTSPSRRTVIRGAGAALAVGALARPVPGVLAHEGHGTPAASPEASPAASPAAIVPVVGSIDELPLKNAGKLTVHTDEPVYEPWFVDDDPGNGKGFESAFVYAVAEALGFTKDQVEWGRTAFNQSYAPGEKPFDFYLAEVSITEDRKKAVDFSDPYYAEQLVVVTKKDSPVLEARSLEDLRKFQFGTQVGTTYLTYITDKIKPEKDPMVFDTNADSLTALENGTVDLGIQTLSIGIYNTTIQFQDLALGGLLPGTQGDGMGLVFEKGSALVPFVNKAIAEVIATGTRDALVSEWIPVPPGIFTYTE